MLPYAGFTKFVTINVGQSLVQPTEFIPIVKGNVNVNKPSIILQKYKVNTPPPSLSNLKIIIKFEISIDLKKNIIIYIGKLEFL